MADNDPRLDPAAERRASRRFAIEQELLYRVLDHRAAAPESGTGKTLDISSKGVLFETAQCLRPGKRVEVSVNWPALLDGGCPLKFVAVGRVVRAEETRAAMHIEQHEFRTRRSQRTARDRARKAIPRPRTVLLNLDLTSRDGCRRRPVPRPAGRLRIDSRSTGICPRYLKIWRSVCTVWSRSTI